MEFELLIPLFAIVGGLSIPVFWFFYDSRNRASRDRVIEKAIESDLSIDEVRELFKDDNDKPSSPRKMPYRKGLILMGIGIGLLAARKAGYLPQASHDDPDGGMFGLVALFLGIGLFLSDFFNRKRFDHSDE
ncbi:MAG: hypothetical protein GY879_02020 [Planctomycetes bacterium]|nr:hypothetical protein [Planctomycetota bacterium]